MAYQIDRHDHSSEAGARALAKAIEQHWKAQGYDVAITLVPQEVGSRHETIWSIRTDLRAGLPARRANAEQVRR